MRLVAATVVNGDTDGEGLLAVDTSLLIKFGKKNSTINQLPDYIKYYQCCTNLEFLKGEATTSSELGVVLDGRATDGGAEKAINGSRSNTSSLLDACDSSGLLATGLIEPGLDTALPVLTEMLVGQLIVVFQNHCSTGRVKREKKGFEQCQQKVADVNGRVSRKLFVGAQVKAGNVRSMEYREREIEHVS